MQDAASLDNQTDYIAGLQGLRDGTIATAVPLLEQALRRQPGHPSRRRNLVRGLLAAGAFGQALQCAQDGSPDDPDLHLAAGAALAALGRPGAARQAFAQALALRPGHAATWQELGNAWADLDDAQAAEAHHRMAIRLDPASPEAVASLGIVLTQQGRLTEAIAACEAAIRMRPDFAQAHWARAFALLLSGDLAAGFAAFEWRKHHPGFRQDFVPLPGPEWDGADPGGRTILVRAEQGAGDTIQFARYLRDIRDAGGRPILVCPPALRRLICSIPAVRAVPLGDPLPAYDAWIDLGSLPARFGTTLGTIPFPDGYLQADPDEVRAWRLRLPPTRRVGIAFAGNPLHTGDRRRSIAPSCLAPMLGAPGAAFVNLQHGKLAGAIGLPDLTQELPSYAATAALIAALDLVITVDTSIAHLAGALGTPVWVLLPFAPDWRWMLDRTDSPWYRGMRLYRQAAAGDWATVIARVAHDLACSSGTLLRS